MLLIYGMLHCYLRILAGLPDFYETVGWHMRSGQLDSRVKVGPNTRPYNGEMSPPEPCFVTCIHPDQPRGISAE